MNNPKKGKNTFTKKEAKEIKEYLISLRSIGRDGQKDVRGLLRSEYEFYITDYSDSTSGFTASDFDYQVSIGAITITGNKTKKQGQRGPDKKPRNYGGGMPTKPEEEKAKSYPCSLYPEERDQAVDKFGKLGEAVRWAIKNKKE